MDENRIKNYVRCAGVYHVFSLMIICALMVISLPLWSITVFFILFGVLMACILLPYCVAWCADRRDLLVDFYEFVP